MSFGNLFNRCPHVRIRGVFGDEINHTGSRLRCLDCKRYLDGGLALATHRRAYYGKERGDNPKYIPIHPEDRAPVEYGERVD